MGARKAKKESLLIHGKKLVWSISPSPGIEVKRATDIMAELPDARYIQNRDDVEDAFYMAKAQDPSHRSSKGRVQE